MDAREVARLVDALERIAAAMERAYPESAGHDEPDPEPEIPSRPRYLGDTDPAA